MDREKMRCESCAWYDGTDTRCRFNPPTDIGFPLVLADDWCRQWAATSGRLALRDEMQVDVMYPEVTAKGPYNYPVDRFSYSSSGRREGKSQQQQSDGDRAVRMSEVVAAQAAEIAKDVKAMRDDQLADNLQEVRREAERLLIMSPFRGIEPPVPWRNQGKLDTSRLKPGAGGLCKDPHNVTQDEIDAAAGTPSRVRFLDDDDPEISEWLPPRGRSY